MATVNPAIGLGGFTGKQMKAIMGFCNKDNAIHLLHTPFFYGGKLYSTNQYVALVMNANTVQNQRISQDKAWSIPSDVVEKCLVKDAFYPSAGDDGTPVWVKFGTEVCHVFEDHTKQLAEPAEQLKELAERDADVSAAPQWLDPKLMEKVCALADAFGVSTVKAETVPYRGVDFYVRVKFYGRDDMTAIIMPKKV